MPSWKRSLQMTTLALLAAGFAACGGAAPSYVEVTRLVPQTVVVTQIVVRIVTTTPTSAQGSPTPRASYATPPGWFLPEGFAQDVYLPPFPLSGAGAVTFTACPNLQGLEEFAGFRPETAIDLINKYRSGDLRTMQEATDPAMWSTLTSQGGEVPKVSNTWIKGKVIPAGASTYADMLVSQCGSDVVRLSWSADICPSPCASGGSVALESHYFFLWRSGIALIWVVL